MTGYINYGILCHIKSGTVEWIGLSQCKRNQHPFPKLIGRTILKIVDTVEKYRLSLSCNHPILIILQINIYTV